MYCATITKIIKKKSTIYFFSIPITQNKIKYNNFTRNNHHTLAKSTYL